MNMFTKLPGYVKTPAGLEREVLRRLPGTLLFGTILLGAPSLITRLLQWYGSEAGVELQMNPVDFYAIGLIMVHWTIVFTVAIGAFIVMVMKGPAYVADAYPLEDAETPTTRRKVNSPVSE